MEFEQLAALALGDEDAAAGLFRLLEDHLHVYLRGMGINDEDVVQSTLAVVFQRLCTFEDRGRGSFLRWAHGIVRFELANQRRRHGRHQRVAQAIVCVPATPATSLNSLVERRERLQILHEELGELPPAHRRAMEIGLAGGDARELAASEGISIGAARMLKCRAKERLQHLVGLRSVQTRPKFSGLRRRSRVRSASARSPEASPR